MSCVCAPLHTATGSALVKIISADRLALVSFGFWREIEICIMARVTLIYGWWW